MFLIKATNTSLYLPTTSLLVFLIAIKVKEKQKTNS